MTNREKFKEVFGYEPDTSHFIVERVCFFMKCGSTDCGSCIYYNYNPHENSGNVAGWDDEYICPPEVKSKEINIGDIWENSAGTRVIVYEIGLSLINSYIKYIGIFGPNFQAFSTTQGKFLEEYHKSSDHFDGILDLINILIKEDSNET